MGTQHLAVDAAGGISRPSLLLREERLHRNVDFRNGPGSGLQARNRRFSEGPRDHRAKRRRRTCRARRARSIRRPAHAGSGASHQSSRSGRDCDGRRRFANSTALPKCSGPSEGVRFRQGSGHADSSGETWRCQRCTRRSLAVAVVGGTRGAAGQSNFPLHDDVTFARLEPSCGWGSSRSCQKEKSHD